MQSIATVKRDKVYQVLGYGCGRILVLYESKSEDECDDFADDYVIANNMYYLRTESAYYKK